MGVAGASPLGQGIWAAGWVVQTARRDQGDGARWIGHSARTRFGWSSDRMVTDSQPSRVMLPVRLGSTCEVLRHRRRACRGFATDQVPVWRKRQTRKPRTFLGESPCGFESRRRHRSHQYCKAACNRLSCKSRARFLQAVSLHRTSRMARATRLVSVRALAAAAPSLARYRNSNRPWKKRTFPGSYPNRRTAPEASRYKRTFMTARHFKTRGLAVCAAAAACRDAPPPPAPEWRLSDLLLRIGTEGVPEAEFHGVTGALRLRRADRRGGRWLQPGPVFPL